MVTQQCTLKKSQSDALFMNSLCLLQMPSNSKKNIKSTIVLKHGDPLLMISLIKIVHQGIYSSMKHALPLNDPRETQFKGMLVIYIKWHPRRKHPKTPSDLIMCYYVPLYIVAYSCILLILWKRCPSFKKI